MTADKESWLVRWSRRKLAERTKNAPAQERGATGASPSTRDESAPRPGKRESTCAEMNEVDLEKLDARSDYSAFLRPSVRTEIRTAALRKLWSADPIFSRVDGLQDYADDFTDSAAIPSAPLATAYEIGSGFVPSGQASDQEGDREAAEREGLCTEPSEPDQVSGLPNGQRIKSQQG